MRLLVLVTDAFGGRGGIAKCNRDLLQALCCHKLVSEVVALPRLITDPVGDLPGPLRYDVAAARNKFSYSTRAIRAAALGRYDGIVCAHLNLLPLAACLAAQLKLPLLLVIHGIEAWRPQSALTRAAARYVTSVVSVSEVTKSRFLSWAGGASQRVTVIPNCVDLAQFRPGAKRQDLLLQYGLSGRKIMLTVGRLAGLERYKGFDEVIELLPTLARDIPDIAYLVVGDGRDERRLARKAKSLGVASRVVFAGYVAEDEKPAHYGLADVFVLPSRGEGFGIVLLEALACGVPAVASSVDGGREAVLGGALGELADPSQPADLRRAILRAFRRERIVPAELGRFSIQQFRSRWHSVVDSAFFSA